MRAVVQRVSSASVSGKFYFTLWKFWLRTPTVDGQVISQISRGLMVLVGIGRGKTFLVKPGILVTASNR
jgi:D-Tyr-tRNAtyr deacylase